jgi:hypothetical protein
MFPMFSPSQNLAGAAVSASVITPKPASHDHLKTGQLQRSGQPFL